MRNHVTAIAVVAILAGAAGSAWAGNVVGYNRTVVPANSDVLLSVPFNNAIEGTFTVTGTTGSGVTVADTLVAAKYAGAYYVRFISGNASGLWTTITANGTNDFTLENAAVLALVSNGDQFRVYAHYTVGTLFPKRLYGQSFTSGTIVYVYVNNLAAMTQNKSAAKSATYTTSGGGRWVGTGSTSVLAPETQFVLRNGSAQPLTMMTFGVVPDYTVSMLIAAGGDLVIGSGYPMAVTLKNAGMAGNGRIVYFYDDSATGTNKSAATSATYTTSGGGRWVGTGANGVILPSQAITVRFPAGEAGTKMTITKPY